MSLFYLSSLSSIICSSAESTQVQISEAGACTNGLRWRGADSPAEAVIQLSSCSIIGQLPIGFLVTLPGAASRTGGRRHFDSSHRSSMFGGAGTGSRCDTGVRTSATPAGSTSEEEPCRCRESTPHPCVASDGACTSLALLLYRPWPLLVPRD